MTLSRLLLIHAAITLAAGVVLIVAPAAIPGAVGIHLTGDAFLVAYLLGGAELAIAYLSLFARRLEDPQALRLVTRTLILFHSSSAVVEAFAFSQGVGVAIWGNVVLRAVIVAALWYWGLRESTLRTMVSR